jgi:hypothetical protein
VTPFVPRSAEFTGRLTVPAPVDPALEAPGRNPVGRFIPEPDVRERHETLVRAPAAVVFETARSFDIGSLSLVNLIFRLRGLILGAKAMPTPQRSGFVEEMLGLGWRILAEERDRFLVAGAACRPWTADVVFRPIPPEEFAAFSEPDLVKIAWTLEADSLDAELTRFASETRVAASDAAARRKFRRYWRVFGIGIVTIRRLLLRAVRREAERRWGSGV